MLLVFCLNCLNLALKLQENKVSEEEKNDERKTEQANIKYFNTTNNLMIHLFVDAHADVLLLLLVYK